MRSLTALAVLLIAGLAFGRAYALQLDEHLHECVHDDISALLTSHEAPQVYSDSHSLNRRRARGPLRIRIDRSFLEVGRDSGFTCYSTSEQVQTDRGLIQCTEAHVLSQAKNNTLNLLLDEAECLLGVPALNPTRCATPGLLRVDQLSTLKLPQWMSSCYPNPLTLTIPEKYKTTGQPSTDIVLFVTARPILGSSVLAFAGECAKDQFERPIAGFANFGPAALLDVAAPRSDWNWGKQLGTTVHEITHVLGFSSNKLTSFRDPTNNSRALDRSDVLLETDVSGRNVVFLKTPEVLYNVRKHFSCPTLLGAELEDGGSLGTRGSHWEKRLFNGEYMIGSTSRDWAVSNMTLAFLHDSGWYFPDFSRAEQLLWGQDRGCAFASPNASACSGEGWNGYKCADADARSCSYDRLGKAGCALDNYQSDLPAYYRHFPSNPRLGGADALFDYCPVFRTWSNGWCIDSRNAPALPAGIDQGEKYCTNCRCFDSSLVRSTRTGADYSADLCYETYCAGPGALKVRLGSVWYSCAQGTKLSVDGWGGELECPSDDMICASAAIDPLWPEFISVEPTSAKPDDQLIIKGRNFAYGMKVEFDGKQCETVELADSETLRCTVSSTSEWSDPKYVVEQSYDLVLTSLNGDSNAVGLKAIKFQVKLGTDDFVAFVAYFAENPGMGALIIILCLLACIACCFFCVRQRREAFGLNEDSGDFWT